MVEKLAFVKMHGTRNHFVLVNWLKRAENEDHYDRQTDFNPFHLKD